MYQEVSIHCRGYSRISPDCSLGHGMMARRLGDGLAPARQAHSRRYGREARGSRRPKPPASARVGAKPRLMDSLGSALPLRPDFFQTLERYRHGRAQLLGEQRHPQFFEQPTQLLQAWRQVPVITRRLALPAGEPRGELGAELRIAGRIGAKFIQPPPDGLQIAGKVRDLRRRRFGDETRRQQGLQLGTDVGVQRGLVLERGEFFLHLRVFIQNLRRQPRHFGGQQLKTGLALAQALGESGLVGRQRLDEKGPVERRIHDLRAQQFGGAQRHELHRRLLESGQIFFRMLDLIAQLQGEQTAQAATVQPCGFLGGVEYLHIDRAALVHQGGKADQGVRAPAQLQQFRQGVESPIRQSLQRIGGHIDGRFARCCGQRAGRRAGRRRGFGRGLGVFLRRQSGAQFGQFGKRAA